MICPSRFAQKGDSGFEGFWACLLISVVVCAHSQTVPKPADAVQSHFSVTDFGLAYPLSHDWVRATEMLRKKAESSSNPAPNFDVLLAAVYVPGVGQ